MTQALLIIDVRKTIVEGRGPADRLPAIYEVFNATVGRLTDLKAKAKTAGIPVIIVQNDGPEGHRIAKGNRGSEVVDALAPTGDDILINKVDCDSFHGTDLFDRLTGLGVTHLTIGGCMTQYCVDTAVRRAITLGFDVTLIADGHCTGDTPTLTRPESIAHHNFILDGFTAGDHRTTVRPAGEIDFAA